MHAYEKRMAIVRAGESNLLEGLDTYDPNTDLQAHARGTKRVAVERESYLSKQQLEELRKVQMEREQVCLWWLRKPSRAYVNVADGQNEAIRNEHRQQDRCSYGKYL